MRLTFVVDLRSPTQVQWIRALVEHGDDVQVLSSHPVDPHVLPGAAVSVVPLVFAALANAFGQSRSVQRQSGASALGRMARRVASPQRAAAVRSIIGPTAVRFHRHALQSLIDEHRPDLIHARRIPFEGIAAAQITGPPLVVSTAGNDFTLFASRTRAMANATRRTLQSASALHCDCHRDVRLAREWGFPHERPIWVLPGNGGVDGALFRPGPTTVRAKLGIPETARIIINPRGIREYIRTDVFFASLHPVLAQLPDVHVVCPGMAGSPAVTKPVRELGYQHRVHLLPMADRREMAELFRAARVSVSLSAHDGTPNSLLEAMACGSFPIVGDVESVREWVTDGHNGLVVNPHKPAAVSEALMHALTDNRLVAAASESNQALVRERADYTTSMGKVREYYHSLLENLTTASRSKSEY